MACRQCISLTNCFARIHLCSLRMQSMGTGIIWDERESHHSLKSSSKPVLGGTLSLFVTKAANTTKHLFTVQFYSDCDHHRTDYSDQ